MGALCAPCYAGCLELFSTSTLIHLPPLHCVRTNPGLQGRHGCLLITSSQDFRPGGRWTRMSAQGIPELPEELVR